MPPAPCFYRRESIIRPPLRRQAGRRFFGCPAQSSRRKALPFLLNFRTGKNPRRFPDGRRGAVIRRSGAPDASYSRLVPPRSPAGNGGNVLRTDGKTIEVPLAGRTAEAVCTPAGGRKSALRADDWRFFCGTAASASAPACRSSTRRFGVRCRSWPAAARSRAAIPRRRPPLCAFPSSIAAADHPRRSCTAHRI